MTIDELVDWCASFGPDYESADGRIATQIASLLRAGQEMRDTFDIIGDTTEVNHKALARKGAAYDKLTKGAK